MFRLILLTSLMDFFLIIFFFSSNPLLSDLAFQFRGQLWRKWYNEKYVCNTHQREVNLNLLFNVKQTQIVLSYLVMLVFIQCCMNQKYKPSSNVHPKKIKTLLPGFKSNCFSFTCREKSDFLINKV